MRNRSISGELLRVCAGVLMVATTPGSGVAQLSADQFAGMTARSIGPVGRIGRISAIDAVVSDPNIVYVGAANGGLWKSLNGGQTWKPLFEDRPFSAIGTVTIDQGDPDIVWVGVGEGNPVVDPRVAAVYRSVDGGESWTPGGLSGFQGVKRILLHPTNPDIVIVGVSGPEWEAETEAGRGVYRTIDGGLTWTPVLHVDGTTRVSDLVMDPSDPNRLLAAMSSSRRSAWSVELRGPGSGFFVTRDGGDSWIRLEEGDGIPSGDLGRISLDVFSADPRLVHALVDAGEGVLLRSYNRGRTWQTVRRGPDLLSPLDDPAAIVTDPLDESRLFHLASELSLSEDGGATFGRDALSAGPGYRVLWIHPEDPRLMYGGSDRGLYVSRDGGEHWEATGELPLGSFNHVSVDMAIPFNVYGGLERSGSWRGPALGWGGGGPGPDWIELADNDDFGILVDPSDESRGYAVARGGGLVRFNLETGERKNIRPWAPALTTLRFNRDVPIALDPHDPAAIFYGSQFVHRSVNRGETWQIISGDLTANDPAGRRQPASIVDTDGLTTEPRAVGGPEGGGATITIIAPSPIDSDVIWVGTDEGDIQITRSAGGEWVSVLGRVDGVPDSSWVAHIEPSAIRPGSAIVAFDAHRTGHREPLIFLTDNYGSDWRRIAEASDMEGFVHTVKQDAVAENLLFAGTEDGLYVSLNGGGDWFRWSHGLPRVPVHDLLLHPRDHDLVIATHGRGAYVLDDIRPLRELATNLRIAELEIFVFELPPASIRNKALSGGAGRVASENPWHGEKPAGVSVSYWLGEGAMGPAELRAPGVYRVSQLGLAGSGGSDASPDTADGNRLGPSVGGGLDPSVDGGAAGLGGDGASGFDDLDVLPSDVMVEILDFDGEVVRTLRGPGASGLNRVTWDFMEDPPPISGPLAEFSDAAIGAEARAFSSAEVLPGLFSVRISREGAEGLQWLEVLEDPRLEISVEDRIAKYQAVKLGVNLVARSRALQAAVASVQAELRRVIDWVRDEGSRGSMELLETSQSLGEELAGLADFSGVTRYRPGVLGLTSSYDRPTEGQRLDLIRMEEELDPLTRRIGDFLILDINQFGRRVNAAGLDVSFFIGPIG